MVGIIISILFLIIYIKSTERHNLLQNILLSLCFLGAILYLGGVFSISTMENKGLDNIGEALIYGGIISLGRIIVIISPIIILIIDNIKIIFRKNVMTIIIIIGMAIFLYFPIHVLFTTTKVSENIPTVEDFKNELNQRGFMTGTANYRLYGVSSSNNKAVKLSFEKNNIDKYPLYVYSVIDYPWIIYYANGEIYAVRGKYWDYYTAYNKNTGYNEEKIIWDYSNEIMAETEET